MCFSFGGDHGGEGRATISFFWRGGGGPSEAEDAPREAATGHGGCDGWRRSETGRAQRSSAEVLGGDDTDSDGDEAPRAEEEAAEGAAGEAAEEVKAESAPALEPDIKPEPSES